MTDIWNILKSSLYTVTGSVMKHQAIQDLFLIIKESRHEIREALLKAWEDKWIYHTKQTQLVLNKSLLNTEEIDFVWSRVAQLCVEDLFNNNITNNTSTNTSFSCELWSLRSHNAKFQESTKDTKKIR